MRVREAEFQYRRDPDGPDPDAWDTGVEEPGVPDVHREFTELEFESAWGRWRKEWVNLLLL